MKKYEILNSNCIKMSCENCPFKRLKAFCSLALANTLVNENFSKTFEDIEKLNKEKKDAEAILKHYD